MFLLIPFKISHLPAIILLVNKKTVDNYVENVEKYVEFV